MPYTAPPGKWDHELVIGDTYQPAEVAMTDADGDAYDLTGASGECEIRTEPGGALLLSPTVTITTPASGLFTWSSAATSTASLAPQRARYSVRLTFSADTVKTVLEGVVTIRRSVVEP